MNLFYSLECRIKSKIDDMKSRFWDYSRYYEDGIVWKNTILFESFGGINFQGNPYYIYKTIFFDARFSDYNIYISHQKPKELVEWLIKADLFDSRIEVVETRGKQYRNALSHCKYLINNVSFTMDFIKKEGQVYVNTWHGTPLKCLGRSVKSDSFSCNNPQRNMLMSDYLIAPNLFTKKIYEEEYMLRNIMPGQIIMNGYPRNSVFFNEKEREHVIEKYHLNGKKVIVYMPTWRGDIEQSRIDQTEVIDKLAQQLGDNYVVYVKLHPAMMNGNICLRYCLTVPDDIEIYTFLNVADTLITDYSSVIFDFAIARKPIILYQYDREKYFSDRGIYEGVDKCLPFKTVYKNEDLLDAVINATCENTEEFINTFCKYDTIDSARELIQLMTVPQNISEKESSVDLYVVDFPTSDEWLFQVKEKLGDSNYRFVFIPKRHNKYFSNLHCLDSLYFLVLYTYDRLTRREKVDYFINLLMYKLLDNQRAKEIICRYALREQKRLWGDINIGHVYAKSKHLPTAVDYFVERWPDNL